MVPMKKKERLWLGSILFLVWLAGYIRCYLWSWAQLVSGNYSNLQSITLHHAQPRPGLGCDGIEH